MNQKVKALRAQDEPVVKLEQRRSELLSEREQTDAKVSDIRQRRSDALIAGCIEDADRLDAELTAALNQRTRIEDGLERIQQRVIQERAKRAQQEQLRHRAELTRRIDALGPKCQAIEGALKQAGELGAELIAEVEAIHRLGVGFLSGEDMVLTRMLQSVQALVAIHVDRPLRRELPIQFATEGGRQEYFRCSAPALLLAEARRSYLQRNQTPPPEAA